MHLKRLLQIDNPSCSQRKNRNEFACVGLLYGAGNQYLRRKVFNNGDINLISIIVLCLRTPLKMITLCD